MARVTRREVPGIPATAPRFAALLLAGRRGPADAVAAQAGRSHRALVDVAGVPMIVRVLRTLRASDRVECVRVSVDDPAVLASIPEIEAERRAGRLDFHASRESPAASALDALAAVPDGERLLVTTADHPLLRPEMVEHFCAHASALDADVVAGLVAASVVRAVHPGSRRTFVPLRGESYTGANLFLLRAPGAAPVLAFWRRVEGDRKQPWRLVRHFGPGTLLRFALRRLDLDAALARVSRVTGARVAAVALPFAEAAIDVDRPADHALASRLLAEREGRSPDRHASV